MSEISDAIAAYYPAIDRVEIDRILRLFAQDAVYVRAGAEYRNLPAICKFFREDRQIRGEHIVDQLWSDEDNRTVFVTGRFEGQGVAGDLRSVGFADVWHFNAAGLVSKRQTFLALGHAYVER